MTQKQLAWAEQIKSDAIRNCELLIDGNTARYAETGHPVYSSAVSAAKVMRALLIATFSAHDAAWIIDHRKKLADWQMIVDRWAELLQTGKITVKQLAANNGLPDYEEDPDAR